MLNYLTVLEDCFANSTKCFLASLSFTVNSSDILTFPFIFLLAFSTKFLSFKLENFILMGNGFFFFSSSNLSASSTSTSWAKFSQDFLAIEFHTSIFNVLFIYVFTAFIKCNGLSNLLLFANPDIIKKYLTLSLSVVSCFSLI